MIEVTKVETRKPDANQEKNKWWLEKKNTSKLSSYNDEAFKKNALYEFHRWLFNGMKRLVLLNDLLITHSQV